MITVPRVDLTPYRDTKERRFTVVGFFDLKNPRPVEIDSTPANFG